MERIKLVVIEEHTLGFIIPEMPNYAQTLRASVLKGSTYSEMGGSIYVKNCKQRLASEKDFDDFRVLFGQFSNEQEYEFAK
jgi:hypothetical protein